MCIINKNFETLTNINSLYFTNYHLHYTNLLLVNYHKLMLTNKC